MAKKNPSVLYRGIFLRLLIVGQVATLIAKTIAFIYNAEL